MAQRKLLTNDSKNPSDASPSEIDVEIDHDKHANLVENESDGLETACYRKCHGQFSLNETENHFQYEIPLDFSPFERNLSTFTQEQYERLDELLLNGSTIFDLQKLFQSKRLTSYELCLYYLKRIQDKNKYYKAILELNPQLLNDAREIDKNRTVEQRSQVYGCVAAFKGNISISGLYNDCGSYVLHSKRMIIDAPIVKYFRSQGVLILGRCNLSEWAYGMTTKAPSGFSSVGGQCLHPDDYHQDISGSSSGSACALRLNMCTFTIGTETAGSLLSPAMHAKNVCSLKPTQGTWPNNEIIPLNYDQDTCGPMTKTVEELIFLHQIISKQSINERKNICVGIIGENVNDFSLLTQICHHLNYSVVNLNKEKSIISDFLTIVTGNPSTSSISFTEFLCYAMKRDITDYLSSHSTLYDNCSSLDQVYTWNKEHSKYIPYGQELFTKACEETITEEQYINYKQALEQAWTNFKQICKSKYCDCIITVGDDLFALTTLCKIPRSCFTVNYFNDQTMNLVAIGLDLNSDLLILDILKNIEKITNEIKFDSRSYYEKYIYQPYDYYFKQQKCIIL